MKTPEEIEALFELYFTQTYQRGDDKNEVKYQFAKHAYIAAYKDCQNDLLKAAETVDAIKFFGESNSKNIKELLENLDLIKQHTALCVAKAVGEQTTCECGDEYPLKYYAADEDGNEACPKCLREMLSERLAASQAECQQLRDSLVDFYEFVEDNYFSREGRFYETAGHAMYELDRYSETDAKYWSIDQLLQIFLQREVKAVQPH